MSFCVLLCLAGCQAAAQLPVARAQTPALANAPASRPRDASDDFFEQGVIPQLKIELKEVQANSLRQDARRYVKCKLIEDGKTKYADVAIKLKGAAGSFQNLDEKPALTINMHKHVKGQTFHAMQRFHLNNSVQDDSYLCEWICSDLCHDAKVPATRVTHARVWLNDRDLGLYVLKEGFDKPFLTRHFGDASGNLYDGGFLTDIDTELEKDSGAGPDDYSDLRALQAACQEPDPAKRWPAIEERLDVDAFLTFMAVELMACHWDGYTMNKNNYRLYFDPANGKARFLPHGMDQMFQDPGFTILEYPEPIVAAAVMHNPQWRKTYRERVAKLLPLFEAKRLHERIDKVVERLQPIVKEMGEEFAEAHAGQVRELKERIAAREQNLREQLQQGDPAPQEFDAKGIAEIGDWFPAQETDDSKLEEMEVDGQKRYSIEAGESGECIASWRRKVLLAKGRYRLESRLKAEGVEPRRDEQGVGAGVRISGGRRENQLVGDMDWRNVAYEFEVQEEVRSIVFVIELRATRGRLLLEGVSKLTRLEPQENK